MYFKVKSKKRGGFRNTDELTMALVQDIQLTVSFSNRYCTFTMCQNIARF